MALALREEALEESAVPRVLHLDQLPIRKEGQGGGTWDLLRVVEALQLVGVEKAMNVDPVVDEEADEGELGLPQGVVHVVEEVLLG